MNQDETEDYVLLFEAPKIEAPEFRLYYEEENGKVLFYTCEKPEGKYIVIDAITFATARPDVRVINGRLSTVNPSAIISKLQPDSLLGNKCAKEDISIIVDDGSIEITQWVLITYELG
jgi:hypothetical protein